MQCYILTYFRLMTGSIGDFRCNQRRQITIMRIVNETQTQVIAFHISPVNTVQQGGQMENHQSTQCNRVVRQKITSQHSATGWSDGKSPANTVQQGGQMENQQTREWISTQQLSHKHNEDLSCPQQLSPGMQVNARQIPPSEVHPLWRLSRAN